MFNIQNNCNQLQIYKDDIYNFVYLCRIRERKGFQCIDMSPPESLNSEQGVQLCLNSIVNLSIMLMPLMPELDVVSQKSVGISPYLTGLIDDHSISSGLSQEISHLIFRFVCAASKLLIESSAYENIFFSFQFSLLRIPGSIGFYSHFIGPVP